MRKRLTALLLCLCMVLTMLPVSAMAAVGDLLGNTPEQNASLLEKLESFTGESAEEAQQLLDSLGLLDEDGNLITDQRPSTWTASSIPWRRWRPCWRTPLPT